jgi:hypothetical protein
MRNMTPQQKAEMEARRKAMKKEKQSKNELKKDKKKLKELKEENQLP